MIETKMWNSKMEIYLCVYLFVYINLCVYLCVYMYSYSSELFAALEVFVVILPGDKERS